MNKIKNIQLVIWTLAGILFMGLLVAASTIISDSAIQINGNNVVTTANAGNSGSYLFFVNIGSTSSCVLNTASFSTTGCGGTGMYDMPQAGLIKSISTGIATAGCTNTVRINGGNVALSTLGASTSNYSSSGIAFNAGDDLTVIMTGSGCGSTSSTVTVLFS